MSSSHGFIIPTCSIITRIRHKERRRSFLSFFSSGSPGIIFRCPVSFPRGEISYTTTHGSAFHGPSIESMCERLIQSTLPSVVSETLDSRKAIPMCCISGLCLACGNNNVRNGARITVLENSDAPNHAARNSVWRGFSLKAAKTKRGTDY